MATLSQNGYGSLVVGVAGVVVVVVCCLPSLLLLVLLLLLFVVVIVAGAVEHASLPNSGSPNT